MYTSTEWMHTSINSIRANQDHAFLFSKASICRARCTEKHTQQNLIGILITKAQCALAFEVSELMCGYAQISTRNSPKPLNVYETVIEAYMVSYMRMKQS